MGCLLACFGASRDRRRRKPAIGTPTKEWVQESYKPLRSSPSPKKPALEFVADSLPDSREKNEERSKEKNEEGRCGGARKKVTFDLNIQTIAEVSTEDNVDYSSQNNVENKKLEEEPKPHKGDGEGKSSPSASIFPSNHRYRSCASSDDEESEVGDEDDEYEYEDCDFDEDDDVVDNGGDEEESYESFFSLPLEKETGSLREVSSPKTITSSPDREPIVLEKQNSRDRSQYVHSVLNPIQNLSQWREAKMSAVPTKHLKKENFYLEQEAKMLFSSQLIFKVQKNQKLCASNSSLKNTMKQQVSVDASLSNWLSMPQESESHGSNSLLSKEGQPILGALTVKDLKQSVTPSARRSLSRSPEKIPIVGTVGTCWNCKNQDCHSGSSQSASDVKGIPNTTNKHREDRRVN